MLCTRHALRTALGLALAAPLASSQNLPALLVTDSTNDTVYRLNDVDGNGDYNGMNEILPFYDDMQGSFPLSVNIGIALNTNGIAYVCDSSQDVILALEDLNDDGDAHDAGEASLYFDGTIGGNLSGVFMSSSQDLTFDPIDPELLWVMSAGSSGGVDAVIRLKDLNGDGDANDVGEASEYYLPAPGGAGPDSVPQDVRVGNDGALYYLDSPATGVIQKGVYRLEDIDNSGTIDQPNEVTTFYAPASLQSGFLTSLNLGDDGAFYLTDSLNEQILRLDDANNNGVIDVGSEDSVWYQAVGASLIWETAVGPNGATYAVESQAPDRVLQLIDANDDGTIDPATEVATIYDETLAGIAIGNPRGLTVIGNVVSFTDICFGDGGPQAGCTDCPCGNNAMVGTVGGCMNEAGRSARLFAAGTPSLMNDSLSLRLEDATSNSFAILISGQTVAPTNMMNPCFGLGSGITSPVLDGLRCAVQGVLRHGTRPTDADGDVGAVGGTNDWGPILAGNGFVPGQTRVFQAFYRTLPSMGCMTGQNTSQAVVFDLLP